MLSEWEWMPAFAGMTGPVGIYESCEDLRKLWE